MFDTMLYINGYIEKYGLKYLGRSDIVIKFSCSYTRKKEDRYSLTVVAYYGKVLLLTSAHEELYYSEKEIDNHIELKRKLISVLKCLDSRLKNTVNE